MWFRPGPHHVPPCGHMWKIRTGSDRNLGTSWAISARVFLGLITILISSFNSLFEYDIKNIIAFSTLRQFDLIIIIIISFRLNHYIFSRF